VEAVKKNHPEEVEGAIFRAMNGAGSKAERQKEKNPRL